MDIRLPDRTGNYQMEGEKRIADKAGPKMIQVRLALDQLLETVADMANDMSDEGTTAIQCTSLLLVVKVFSSPSWISFSPGSAEGPPVRLTAGKSMKSTPAITQSRLYSPVTPRARHCVRSRLLPSHPDYLSP